MTMIRTAFSILLVSLALVGCNEDEKTSASASDRWSFELASQSLRDARASFATKSVTDSLKDEPKEIDVPPKGSPFVLASYNTPKGKMAAYLTPDPKDGEKHPAVIWIHGGYGGIASWFWGPIDTSNEQSAQAFRNAGIVMMIPSFRGENANPGAFEMYYGELDDLEAALAALAQLPWVDPTRIYLAGHSTGGATTLLAAEYVKGFRAIFSLGGIPDLGLRLKAAPMRVPPPFDRANPKELELRSARRFLRSIETPTFYFEGEESWWPEFDEIQQIAKKENIPLSVNQIPGGDHFTILWPTTRLIAEKILADKGEKTDISFSKKDIDWISKNIVR